MNRISAWLRNDLRVLRFAAAYALFQFVLSFWDLPGSHGWDNDGVAPRDIFGGLANNLTPGHAHRYPLFHYLVIAILSCPAWLTAVIASPDWHMESLKASLLAVPVMTAVSIVAKALSAVMSGVALVALASICRACFDQGSARWAVFAAALNFSFSYYARSTNLDAPYLMWVCLAVDRAVANKDAGLTQVRSHLIWMGVFAALGVATKDQAYAPLLPVLLWALFTPMAGTTFLARCRWLCLAAAPTYALASGAALNPTGFLARSRLLTGPNNDQWQTYEATLTGLQANVADLATALPSFWWPTPVLAVGTLAAVVCLGRLRRDRHLPQALTIVPLMAGLGNLVLFALLVRRSDHRFVLPFGFFMAIYVGYSVRRALAWAPTQNWIAPVAACALMALMLPSPLALVITQWTDARHPLTDWLAAHARGRVVETYGGLVYQPHVERLTGVTVNRVETSQPRLRNPLLGANEVWGEPSGAAARGADIILISQAYAERFIEHPSAHGRRRPAWQAEAQASSQRTAFFRGALAGTVPGYQLAWQSRLSPAVSTLHAQALRVHGSTGYGWLVFTREKAGSTINTTSTAINSPTTADHPKLRSAPENAISSEP